MRRKCVRRGTLPIDRFWISYLGLQRGVQVVLNLILLTNKELGHFYTLNVMGKFMPVTINLKSNNKKLFLGYN